MQNSSKQQAPQPRIKVHFIQAQSLKKDITFSDYKPCIVELLCLFVFILLYMVHVNYLLNDYIYHVSYRYGQEYFTLHNTYKKCASKRFFHMQHITLNQIHITNTLQMQTSFHLGYRIVLGLEKFCHKYATTVLNTSRARNIQTLSLFIRKIRLSLLQAMHNNPVSDMSNQIGIACCNSSPHTFQGQLQSRSHSQFFVDVHQHQLNPSKTIHTKQQCHFKPSLC